MESPVTLDYATPPESRPLRPLAAIGIAATAALAGPLVGITTNAVNGLVSPTYFVSVMGWDATSNIWASSIVQGIFEGLVVGIIFSVIITPTIAIVTWLTCKYETGLRCVLGLLIAVYCLWLVGGVLGVVFANAKPVFFRSNFIHVPADHKEMLRYAWVGGSIWGEEFGGLLVVIVGLIVFGVKWKQNGGKAAVEVRT